MRIPRDRAALLMSGALGEDRGALVRNDDDDASVRARPGKPVNPVYLRAHRVHREAPRTRRAARQVGRRTSAGPGGGAGEDTSG